MHEIWFSYAKTCFILAVIIGFLIYRFAYKDFPERLKLQSVAFIVLTVLVSLYIFDKIYVSKILTEKIKQGKFHYGKMYYLYGESLNSTRGGNTNNLYIYYYSVDGIPTKMFFTENSPINEKWPLIKSERGQNKVYRVKYVRFRFGFYQRSEVYDVLD